MLKFLTGTGLAISAGHNAYHPTSRNRTCRPVSRLRDAAEWLGLAGEYVGTRHSRCPVGHRILRSQDPDCRQHQRLTPDHCSANRRRTRVRLRLVGDNERGHRPGSLLHLEPVDSHRSRRDHCARRSPHQGNRPARDQRPNCRNRDPVVSAAKDVGSVTVSVLAILVPIPDRRRHSRADLGGVVNRSAAPPEAKAAARRVRQNGRARERSAVSILSG